MEGQQLPQLRLQSNLFMLVAVRHSIDTDKKSFYPRIARFTDPFFIQYPPDLQCTNRLVIEFFHTPEEHHSMRMLLRTWMDQS